MLPGGMTLAERITHDLTAAMKARDPLRVSTLRMAKAALQSREIDKRAPLDDAEALKVVQTLARQREDSITQYRAASRDELAEKESAELAVLQAYLPAEASDAEVEAAVEQAVSDTTAASMKDMGRVMKAALAILAGSGKPVDGRRVNDAVKRRLAG